MTDMHDFSRLPVDPNYWDDLEARIMSDLGPLVRQAGSTPLSPWAPLAARAWSLGGLAVAAALAALLLTPARTVPAPASPAGLFRLPDNDPALVAFLSAPAPPPITTLLLAENGTGR